MIFHKHTNASGVVVFEIPENVWFATNLRLYLTGHGAHTDMTEIGSEVHVRIDTDIEIMCCIANADEPTTVKTTTYENYKDSKSIVHFHRTFDDVLQYIRFMRIFNVSKTRLYARDQSFMDNVNSATPPVLSRNYYM